jgi:hypothetical protein
MQTITWTQPCYFCHKPILRGRPTLILSTDHPELLGITHSTCYAHKYRYAQYQTCPPHYLTNERVSFWMHFYPKVYKLPGAYEPNRALRYCLVDLLYEAPDSLDNPIKYLKKFQIGHSRDVQDYTGDLETEFLRFLAQVQKLAKEQPVDVEVDFRKKA